MIGIGGFLGAWFIISIGIYHLIKVITLPLVDAFPLLGQNKEKDYILFITIAIGFYVTFILWASLDEFIKSKEKIGREEHIQYRLQDLRRDYLYDPYNWVKKEYEAHKEDTSVDMETLVAFIKGEPIDETEKKKIERSHAIMEEIDKRNEAECEEIKHDAVDKVKVAIDDCNEKINSTKENGSLMALKDELEALYRLLDEISGEDKESKSSSEDFQEKKKS